MTRTIFFIITTIGWLGYLFLLPYQPQAHYGLIFLIPYTAIGYFDLYISRHTLLKIYPVIGHFRYLFEFIRPEIQQYFVATNLSGRPYNRELRSLIYQRAKNVADTHPFGTEHDIHQPGYLSLNHSLNPIVHDSSRINQRIVLGEGRCQQPYQASLLNISAMSFGALGHNAIRALNLGAKRGGFAHNTGEGGLSPYHLEAGGDLIWQIGTAYFGCRTPNGQFDATQFADKAAHPSVKMIEIKLSQGAKPAHGGILPASKISEEIAAVRGIPMGQDCISPAKHSSFDSPISLLEWLQSLRRQCQKPVGIKLCIGQPHQFMAICKAMCSTGIIPDFITIDGAEGGTGAAPLEFTNRLGRSINEGLAFAHYCLVGAGLRDQTQLIASGKMVTGFDLVCKVALGANLFNMARPMMMALGCIQALHCNTNHCPTGITTQDPTRNKALNVEHKAKHVQQFHDNTLKAFYELLSAMGYQSAKEVQPSDILIRCDEGHHKTLAELFHQIPIRHFLDDKNIHPFYADHWHRSDARSF